jgi:hypothetical protein
VLAACRGGGACDAQDLLTARRGTHRPHKPHKSRHAYALRGLLFCGVCDRRMQGHWANAVPYYRCRFPDALMFVKGGLDDVSVAAVLGL